MAVPHKTGQKKWICMHAELLTMQPYPERKGHSRGFRIWFYHVKKWETKMKNIQICTNFKQSPRKIGRRKKDQHNQNSHQGNRRSNSDRRTFPAFVHLPGRVRVQTDLNVFATSVQFPTAASHILKYFCYTLVSAAPNMSTWTWKLNWRWL